MLFRSRVFQYNRDGDLLGVFGGKGDHLGGFIKPLAVEKLGEDYLVLENLSGTVTVFSPTEYGKLLFSAMKYYNRGEYIESVAEWENVLKYNNNMSLAYKSLGKACLQKNETEKALEYLRISGDKAAYSQAVEQSRKLWLKDNMVLLLIIIIVALIFLRFAYRFLRKWMGFEVRKRRFNVQ